MTKGCLLLRSGGRELGSIALTPTRASQNNEKDETPKNMLLAMQPK